MLEITSEMVVLQMVRIASTVRRRDGDLGDAGDIVVIEEKSRECLWRREDTVITGSYLSLCDVWTST